MAGQNLEDDLDDSLLMLAAGGVESGEEDNLSPKEPGTPRSRSQSPAASRYSSRSPSRSPISSPRSRQHSPRHSPRSPHSDRKSPTSTDARMPSKNTSRRARHDSEEEGEASDIPGSPHSLGSDAMDESDSEASDDDFDDGKSKLAGLTGLEREQRLAELAEQENERRKKDQLKALVSQSVNRDASKSSKRKASSADLDEDDDDFQSANRRRAKREEAVQALRNRRSGNQRGTRKGRSQRSTPDADGESDYEPEIDPPGELNEYQRVRIGRTNFADVCFYPDYQKYLMKCFARVCFSVDSVTGENQYRMTQIKDFKLGRPYRIETKNGHAHMCDQYFVAAYGSIEREYPFIACSDSKFTEAEFMRWKSQVDKDGMNQMTSKSLQKTVKSINDLIHKQWTSSEINWKLEKQIKLDHLLRADQNKQAVGAETMRRDQALQQRNLATRKHNQEVIRAALIEERRKTKEASIRAAAEQKKKEQEKAMAADAELFGSGTEEKKPPKKVSLYHQRDVKKSLTSFAKRKTDDEIMGEMDFAIDVEI